MDGVSTIELLLRMTASLLMIGGLLWIVQRMGRKRLGGLGRSAQAPIEVTARKQLSRASSIALVRAGERNLLIGVTDTGVSLIAEGDDLTALPAGAENETRSAKSNRRSADLRTAEKQAVESLIRGSDTNQSTSAQNKTKPSSGAARKPRSGANSSNHSGTRALDALRDMTVRRV